MSKLNSTLNRVYGDGVWSMGVQGIMVGGRCVIPKARLKLWLVQQSRAAAAMPMVPIVRPKPVSIPQPLDPAVFEGNEEIVSATPMPFLRKPKDSAPTGTKKASSETKSKKTSKLKCSKCAEIWEDCSCGLVWCPYCGYEPPSGTQRGLDMHVKARHPEIDW